MKAALAAAALGLGAGAGEANAALIVEDRLAAEDAVAAGRTKPSAQTASRPEEWATAAQLEATGDAPFDASPVPLTQKARFELHAGLWLVEQAGRLRTSNPALGMGLSGMLTPRVRWDVGYLVTYGRVGTPNFNVLNVYQALRARGHFGWALGGAHLFAGGGPVATLVTSSHSINGATTDGALKLEGGAEVAIGLQTEVGGRGLRFEVAAASRSWRVDGRAGISFGF